jgi:hypothetical protein
MEEEEKYMELRQQKIDPKTLRMCEKKRTKLEEIDDQEH